MDDLTQYTILSLIYVVSSIILNCYLAWRLNTKKAEILTLKWEKRSLERQLWEMRVYYQGVKPLGLEEEE